MSHDIERIGQLSKREKHHHKHNYICPHTLSTQESTATSVKGSNGSIDAVLHVLLAKLK